MFNIGTIAGDAILSVVTGLLLVIRSIITWLIHLAGQLLSAMLAFNQTLVGDLTNPNSFIVSGWSTFRDLADLGFVFGIILIAVATILRWRGYQAQQILWKLIVAALIVNFSLVICGVFLKTSDVFSNYFLQVITQSGNSDAVEVAKDAGNDIVAHLGYVGLFVNDKTKDAQKDILAANSESSLAIHSGDIVAIFTQIVVGIFISLVLLVLAVMFLLRYFNLAFLLILAPGMWLLWIFPVSHRYWYDWWHNFIKWVFYAPLMLFFVYLSIITMQKASSYTAIFEAQGNVAGQGAGAIGFNQIMISVMAGAMLIGGMKVAQKMGLAGAGLVLSQASKAQKWTQTRVTRGAARVAAKPTGWAAKGLTAVGGTRVGRWVGAGRVAQRMTAARVGMEKKAAENIEDRKKEYNALGSKDLAALIPTMTTEQRVAALEILGSRGDFSEAEGKMGSPSDMIAVMERMKMLGRGKQVSDIQKQTGMSLDMLKAAASKDEAAFSESAGKFYGGFSPDDWKKTAAGVGNLMFDPAQGNLPGMDDKQSQMIRSAYMNAIATDPNQAGVSATASKLKKNRMQTFYREMISRAGKLGESTTTAEVKKTRPRVPGPGEMVFEGQDLGTEQYTETTTTKRNLDQEFEAAVQAGDFDRMDEIAGESDNPKIKSVIKKMRKSMGSLAFEGEGGEKKEEEKKEEKKK